MKKWIIRICAIIFFAILATYVISEVAYKKELYEYVDSNNFVLTYRQSVSLTNFKYYEITIMPDGSYVNNKYMFNGDIVKKYGYYDSKDIKKFIKFAIKNKIYKMPDNMFAKGVDDGGTVTYIIKLGEKQFKAGGYMPSMVDRKFKKIDTRFWSLPFVEETN